MTMQIYDAKVNHLVNPLGFWMQDTVFSWKVANAEGTRQDAARIAVYTKDQKTILADTGWDKKASSLGTKVTITLLPRTKYYWKVFVRSNAGEEAESDFQWFETGKRDEPWTAKWISVDSSRERHPFFEKEIVPRGKVKNARLYVCGLGLYEGYYNGNRIGEEYLTPYSNDYNRWVQVETFDVTDLMTQKETLSFLLGNGWYKGRFGFFAKEEKGYYGNEWKLLAELHLEYEDGTTDVIGTDDTWTVTRSNITYSSLYDGERRDDTLDPLPKENVVYCDAPKGTLTDRLSLPVTVHEVFEPKELIPTPLGEQVLDMGQEFSGIFTLRVHEPKGTVIHIQTGEILQNGDFYRDNLRSAKSEYWYTSNGEETTIKPHFTYYGYRYVKIEGVADLKKEDFKGLALYSGIEEKGNIVTGHVLVNQLISNVRWGLRSNFVDVPTDCPQRDERMGWTGDAQVFSPTAMYLTDCWAFYQKYLYDMNEEQKDLGGMVPDVVPSAGDRETSSVWGDAACIIPWNLYVFYGDKTILEHQYDSMKAWVEYIRKEDGNDHRWRKVFHYGDWLALDHPAGGAEQTFGGTDEEFIASVYYAASAQILSKASHVLGKKEEEKEYAALSQREFADIRREYYSATGRCCIKTQTALVLTLKYHLSSNEELVKKQLRKLFRDGGDKLKTGFVGTPLLCHVLSDNGMEDLSWKLLLNEEYPGWLREVKLGATTVWERWNSLLDDGTISGTSMNSMNHYAYGSIVEWIFRHAAGLNVSEQGIGAKYMVIAPEPNEKVQHLSAEYDSPSGLWNVSWEVLEPTRIRLLVTVPFDCEAEIVFPFSNQRKKVGAGSYEFVYETQRLVKTFLSTSTPIRELASHPEVKEALKGIIDLDQVSWHMQQLSLREMASLYQGSMNEQKLDEIDEILRGI